MFNTLLLLKAVGLYELTGEDGIHVIACKYCMYERTSYYQVCE
jgi:disulfide bond formation protein DsbB